MRSWLLVLLIALPAVSAAVQPQQVLVVPNNGGQNFGGQLEARDGAALAATLGEGFFGEGNGDPATHLLIRDAGSRWRIDRTLPPWCSEAIVPGLAGSPFLHALGAQRLYVADPCRADDRAGFSLDLMAPVDSVGYLLAADRLGVIDPFITDPAFSALAAVHSPPAGGFIKFGQATVAGDGWFAVQWTNASFPEHEIGWSTPIDPHVHQEHLSLYVQDAVTPALTLHGPPGVRQVFGTATFDKEFYVSQQGTWSRYHLDGSITGPFPDGPPPGVGHEGTRVFVSGEELVVLRGSPYPVEVARIPLEAGYPVDSLAASGDVIAYGSRAQYHCEPVEDSLFGCNDVTDRPGMVFVYHRGANGEWRLHERIVGPSPGRTAFGASVAVTGGQILIGDPLHDFGRIHIRTMNQWPTAAFKHLPESPLTLVPVTFTDLSTDPEGQRLAQAWDFDGDGKTDASGPFVKWTFKRPGLHTVTLRVTDTQEGSDAITKTIEVRNRPPIADHFLGPEPIWRTRAAQGNDLSHDLDGEIVAWHWDFGDGRTSAEQHPKVTYPHKGIYTVRLTVTDDWGDSATSTRDIQVFNHHPVVTLTADRDPITLEPVTITATATDPDGHVTRTAWLGRSEPGLGLTLVPQRAGTQRVVFEAYDDEGDRTVQWLDLEVENRPPVADFLLPTGTATRTPLVFVDRSVDPDGRVTRWQWDFGDGNTTNDPSARHTYAAKGTYDVVLEVMDDSGAWSQPVTKTIVIDNHAPLARIDAVPDDDGFVITDASVDPDGEIVVRRWSVDGVVMEHPPQWRLLATAGSRLVELFVQDDRGSNATARLLVGTVLPPLRFDPPPATTLSTTPTPTAGPAAVESVLATQETQTPPPASRDETASPWWIVMAILLLAAVAAAAVVLSSRHNRHTP